MPGVLCTDKGVLSTGCISTWPARCWKRSETVNYSDTHTRVYAGGFGRARYGVVSMGVWGRGQACMHAWWQAKGRRLAVVEGVT